MSRSYKKHGVMKDNDGAGKKKYWKKVANHKVRRYVDSLDDDNVPNKPKYKRIMNSYDICDFAFDYDEDASDDAYKYFMK